MCYWLMKKRKKRLQVRVKYIGETCRSFVQDRYYDIEFNASPRGVWVGTDTDQKSYINLTNFALDWDIIDREALDRVDDAAYKMKKCLKNLGETLEW